MGPDEDILSEEFFPIGQGPTGGKFIALAGRNEESLLDLCRRMRLRLATDHVICPEARAADLQGAFRRPDSPVLAELGRGFVQLVVVEVSAGLDRFGSFDHDGTFLPYLKRLLYGAFGLEETEDYHPEQVPQVLKDEPPSLFCFLDAHLMPADEVQRLRMFTQTEHRVLLCASHSSAALIQAALPEGVAYGQPASPDADDEPKEPVLSERVHVPVLKQVTGPGAGRLFHLEEEVTTIGRGDTCEIVLDGDSGVSRRHAEILRRGEAYLITDLGSRNGTRVNDVEVQRGTEQLLRAGDMIDLAGIRLAYYKGPFVPDPSPGHRSDDADSAADLALDFEMGSKFVFDVAAVRPEAKLGAILELGRRLGGVIQLEAVGPNILEALADVFSQADRLFLILVDPGTNGLVCKAARFRSGRRSKSAATPPAEEAQLRISRSIVNYVLSLGRPSLSQDAGPDQDLPTSISIADLGIRSVMCAPLIVLNHQPLGILYLESCDRKPFQQEDLDLLSVVAGQAAGSIHRARLHALAMEQVPLERAQEVAARLHGFSQSGPVPQLPGWDVFASASRGHGKMVGGDFHVIQPLPHGRVAIAVGEVPGSGFATALTMAKLSTDVRTCLVQETSPAAAVESLNRSLIAAEIGELFATLCLVVLDVATRTLTLSSAGHPAIMLRRGNGAVEEFGEEDIGFPLGIMPDCDYRQFDASLRPGDVAVVYSDGVTDARNLQEDLYHIKENPRLTRCLAATPGGATTVGRRILEEIRGFSAGQFELDDLTLICLGPVEEVRKS